MDIIDHLAGVEPGSSLDGIRARRLQARENAQKSYLALFEPADFGDVPASDRYAVAAFVAGLHDELTVAAFWPSLPTGQSWSKHSRRKSNEGGPEGRMAHFRPDRSRWRTRPA